MRPLTSGRSITPWRERNVPTAWASSSMRRRWTLPTSTDRPAPPPPHRPPPAALPAPGCRRSRGTAGHARRTGACSATTTRRRPARRGRPRRRPCESSSSSSRRLLSGNVSPARDHRAASGQVVCTRDATIGQRVGALVARVAGMALHPAPVHLVRRRERVQALPQVDVLHRLAGRRSSSRAASSCGSIR